MERIDVMAEQEKGKWTTLQKGVAKNLKQYCFGLELHSLGKQLLVWAVGLVWCTERVHCAISDRDLRRLRICVNQVQCCTYRPLCLQSSGVAALVPD